MRCYIYQLYDAALVHFVPLDASEVSDEHLPLLVRLHLSVSLSLSGGIPTKPHSQQHLEDHQQQEGTRTAHT